MTEHLHTHPFFSTTIGHEVPTISISTGPLSKLPVKEDSGSNQGLEVSLIVPAPYSPMSIKVDFPID